MKTGDTQKKQIHTICIEHTIFFEQTHSKALLTEITKQESLFESLFEIQTRTKRKHRQ